MRVVYSRVKSFVCCFARPAADGGTATPWHGTITLQQALRAWRRAMRPVCGMRAQEKRWGPPPRAHSDARGGRRGWPKNSDASAGLHAAQSSGVGPHRGAWHQEPPPPPGVRAAPWETHGAHRCIMPPALSQPTVVCLPPGSTEPLHKWGVSSGVLMQTLRWGYLWVPPPPLQSPPLCNPPPHPGDRHFHVFLVNMYRAGLCCPSALHLLCNTPRACHAN